MTVRRLQAVCRFSRNELSGEPGAVHHASRTTARYRKPRPGRDVRDVVDPKPNRPRGREGALDQVGSGPGRGITPHRPDVPPPTDPGHVGPLA
jgi:hypothetical protein